VAIHGLCEKFFQNFPSPRKSIGIFSGYATRLIASPEENCFAIFLVTKCKAFWHLVKTIVLTLAKKNFASFSLVLNCEAHYTRKFPLKFSLVSHEPCASQ